ncbi:helix-turn-helix transcriptional regulator [Vibrio cyclitrophicus]|uniref:helix-turn-helix transcriptional regulator n=1 Tax=Vibrio cyclitrophicus TaxID=47951 RepID=UPI000C857906|nr:AlpA family phage regulatory protein [Vibrio cyclitrophicus]
MPDKLITIKEMMELIGKKRSTIYKMVKDGRLPRPVVVNNRTQGWTLSSYEKWIESNS